MEVGGGLKRPRTVNQLIESSKGINEFQVSIEGNLGVKKKGVFPSK